MIFSGYIFDVEGTLMDCEPQTLSGLRDTLAEWSIIACYETLQRYSGLDGEETLKIVAPALTEQERKRLLAAHGNHFEKAHLPTVRAFAGVRKLFETIKAAGGVIGLATDCKGMPLKVYRRLLDVDDLIDHVACGEDADKGKPIRGSCVCRSKSSVFPPRVVS